MATPTETLKEIRTRIAKEFPGTILIGPTRDESRWAEPITFMEPAGEDLRSLDTLTLHRLAILLQEVKASGTQAEVGAFKRPNERIMVVAFLPRIPLVIALDVDDPSPGIKALQQLNDAERELQRMGQRQDVQGHRHQNASPAARSLAAKN